MVSGGADSTCLMHLLARIHDGPVGVLAIDHGLRPSAAAEVEGVVAAAAALGLRAHREALAMEPGSGLQERARDLRMAAARRVAGREGYARIATGHTASDQAETVLFRLARGTGRTGALGMAPERDGVVRPLLVLDAGQTRAWCAARGIAVVRDPSNDDPAHARARVRGGLVPALAAVHPGAERHVAALAEVLRDEAELLEPLVGAAWSRAHAGGGLRPDILRAEPPALRRLLIRRLVAEAGLPGDALGAEPVARTLGLLDGDAAVALPGGGRAAIEGGRLVVSGPPAPPPAAAPLGVPGRVAFGPFAVSAREGAAAPPRPDRVAVRCAEPLTVRPARPGDRLAIRGGGRVGVGRLLAGAGVPPRLRPHVPVVATAGRVVWVAGHRAADDLIATGSGPALVLALEPA
jgi:tRNA(Ile)-lysidine synthase